MDLDLNESSLDDHHFVSKRRPRERNYDANHAKRTRTGRPIQKESILPRSSGFRSSPNTQMLGRHLNPSSTGARVRFDLRDNESHESASGSSSNSSPSSGIVSGSSDSSASSSSGSSNSRNSSSPDSGRLSPISILRERLGMGGNMSNIHRRVSVYSISSDDDNDVGISQSRNGSKPVSRNDRHHWDSSSNQTESALQPGSSNSHSGFGEASTSGCAVHRHASHLDRQGVSRSPHQHHHHRHGHGGINRNPRNTHRGLHFSSNRRAPDEHSGEFHQSRGNQERSESSQSGHHENRFHRGSRSDYHSRRHGNSNRGQSSADSPGSSSSSRCFNDLQARFPYLLDPETDEESLNNFGSDVNVEDSPDEVSIVARRSLSRFMGNSRLEGDRDVVVVSPDPVRQVQQMEEDEQMARMLQAEFDAEVEERQRPPPPPRRRERDDYAFMGDLFTWDSGLADVTFQFDTSESSEEEEEAPPERAQQRRSRYNFRRHQVPGRIGNRRSRESPGEPESRIPISLLLGFRFFSDHRDYESLIQLGEEIGDVPRGLKQSDINRLPTKTVGMEAGTNSQEEPKSCHICLEDYKRGNVLRVLPCIHDFHKPCVDKWLKKNGTCPLCRENVLPRS